MCLAAMNNAIYRYFLLFLLVPTPLHADADLSIDEFVKRYTPFIEKIVSDMPVNRKDFDYREAKTLLHEEVYKVDRTTFYCGCRYTRGKSILKSSCGVAPRKNHQRADRVEWEHIVPVSDYGKTRACWKTCPSDKKRSCCREQDTAFRLFESDLYNLVPAEGELNSDRNNLPYGVIPGENRTYGQCDFEVDFVLDRAEPADTIKGDIARTYFYMEQTYGIYIPTQQKILFKRWAKQDPVSREEKDRARRIEKLQGNRNTYVLGEN